MKQFTSKQIEAIVGLKANTLHYYIEAGAITPGIDAGHGRGTRRLFTEENLVEAVLVRQMIELGMPKRFIVDGLKSIREAGDQGKLSFSKIDDPMAGFLVFRTAGESTTHQFLRYDDNDPMATLWSAGKVAVFVNLNALATEYQIRARWTARP